MKIKFIALVAFTVCITSCKKEQPDKEVQKFEYGRVRNDVYKNKFFNFHFNLPKGWYVQSREETTRMFDESEEYSGKKNDTLKKALDASEISSDYLLSTFKEKPGSNLSFNPSINVTIENVGNNPYISTPGDYLQNVRQALLTTGFEYEFLEDSFIREEINEIVFYRMDTVIRTAEGNVTQKYYCTLSKGFSIVFMLTYNTDDDWDKLQLSKNSIRYLK